MRWLKFVSLGIATAAVSGLVAFAALWTGILLILGALWLLAQIGFL